MSAAVLKGEKDDNAKRVMLERGDEAMRCVRLVTGLNVIIVRRTCCIALLR